MYICPHCDKPGIAKIRKMFLGPALPATCKSCGRQVGVPKVDPMSRTKIRRV